MTNHFTNRSLLPLLALCFTLAACSSSREAAMPKAAASMEAQLVEKHIAALGGLEALQSIQSVVQTGTAQAMGMGMDLIVYIQRPQQMRLQVDIESMGMQVVNAYDGASGTAWEINPMMGGNPTKVTDSRMNNYKDQADIDGFLVDYQSKMDSLIYVGEAEVQGAPAHQLRIVRAGQDDVYAFLDAETMLLVKYEAQGPDPMSGAMTKTETYFSDFREGNGVMWPHHMEIYIGGQRFNVIDFDDIEFNTGLDDELFAYPGG